MRNSKRNPINENEFNSQLITIGDISAVVGIHNNSRTTYLPLAMCRKFISDGLKVVWLEAERSEYYARRHYLWITEGLEPKLDNVNFEVVTLKTRAERLAILKEYIEVKQPDIIFLNSVLDFVDYTDIDGSVKELREMVEGTPCHIVCVAHKNFSNILKHLKKHCESVTLTNR